MNKLFNELPILNETKEAIKALGLVETTDIQHHTIDHLLEKKRFNWTSTNRNRENICVCHSND